MAIETRIIQQKTVFGDWEVKEFIGSGSGGKTAVFRLSRKHEGWEENAALKVVNILEEIGKKEDLAEDYRLEYMDEREELCKQAESEIQLMSRLKGNPHIVEYYDFQFSDYQEENVFGTDLLIRMELLESLREERKRKGEYTPDEVIKIGRDICKGLDFCHKSGVIHRDIKPANIFVTTFGSYKLGDFGIARMVDAGQKASTKMGTRAYAAPEQFMSSTGKYDSRVDIYSMGLTLYELSNHNKLPFAASGYVRESEIQQRILGKEFPAPENATPALTEVIKKACEYKAENRYTSAEELEEALMAAEVGVVPKAVQKTAAKRKERKVPQKATEKARKRTQKRAGKGNETKIATVVSGSIVAVGLLAVLGIWALGQRNVSEPTVGVPVDGNPQVSQGEESENPQNSQTPEEQKPQASQEPEELLVQGDCEKLSVEEYKEIFGEAVSVVTNKETIAVITQTGDLYMWGNNEYGQVGCNSTEYQEKPVFIMKNVAFVTMAEKHTAAITTEGKLYLWGCDESGEIGNDNLSWEGKQLTPIFVLNDIKKVALGEGVSLALSENGDLYTWGSPAGNGMGIFTYHPVVIAHDMVDIATNGTASGAINEKGELYTWGSANWLSGRGADDLGVAPAKIMDDVERIWFGPITAAALQTDGDLYVWGENDYGQVGSGDRWSSYTPEYLVLKDVQDVVLSESTSAAITTTGDLYMWGDNREGQIAMAEVRPGEFVLEPMKICSNVEKVALGEKNTAVLKKDGELYLCGSNENRQIDDSFLAKVEDLVLKASDISDIGLNTDVVWAVGEDGSLYVFGE